MPSSKRQLANLVSHSPHIHMLARGSNTQVKQLLAEPTERFVRALATAVEVAVDKGKLKIPPKHRNRAATMLSATKAIRTKKKAVTSQQGRGFFQDVASAVTPFIPLIAAAL